ncbi:His Kinase A (phospho-acceptor) domain-containing protein [Catalinimonas alkaloidigena]|uniref:histidine kinase n=1 Tax=Catalinimonas alkaloidigena TaxID=1075417 RepID=A0A1G9BIZ3_9BACT|nr:HAMP domain-containing sensor histidine kinase [Catalinimonas alkaloidigena]SDK39472.1 His Kinase A (phospho-acceptor) domain-containing protein [Catalinimonas alkaloidigena]
MKREKVWLWIAVVLGGIGGIWQFLVANQPAVHEQHQYVNQVTQRLHDELAKVYARADVIESKLTNTESELFSSLYPQSPYPYFVYQRGQVIYWSDNLFVPDFEDVWGMSSHEYLPLATGWFVVYRRALSHDRLLVFLIPTIKSYQITNAYLKEGLNTDIFPSSKFRFALQPGPFSIQAPNGDFLFSLVLPANLRTSSFWEQTPPILCFLMAMVAFSVVVFQLLNKWRRRGYVLGSMLALIAYVVGLRLLMLALHFPYARVSWNLYDPRYFASSWFAPSLGDLFTNVLLAFLLMLYVLRYLPQVRAVRALEKAPLTRRQLASGLVLCLSFLTLWGFFLMLKALFFNSQGDFDINASLEFSGMKLVTLSIVVLLSQLFFGIVHLWGALFLRWMPDPREAMPVAGVVGFIFFVASLVPRGLPLTVLLLGSAYFLLLYLWRLPRYLRRFGYKSYLYFFSCAIVCAGIEALAVYQHQQQATLQTKQRLATQLLMDNDPWAEHLLYEAMQKISADDFIKIRFLNMLGSKELIEQKIRRSYLNTYFDKYDVQVAVFNANGEILSDIGEDISYERLRRIYDKPENRTEYKNIFLNNEYERNRARRYLTFIPIRTRGLTLGYIVIELRSKRIIPNTVYPELLVDKQFSQPPRNYSYAIYVQDRLQYSYGDFNYDNNFPDPLSENPKLFEEGISAFGEHHLAVCGDARRYVVISTPEYPLRSIFSNFSFVFLVLTICILAGLLFFALVRHLVHNDPLTQRLTFANKIQIYLNLAFLIPLLTSSVVILSVVSDGLQQDLQHAYMRQADVTGSNVINALEQYQTGVIGAEALGSLLLDIARNTETDLNLFDTDGRLIVSTQPMIYEKNLLARYLSPQAMATVVEHNQNYVVLQEQVGTLNYSSVYRGMRSYETGQLLGVLSIPFFESKAELDRQIIDLVGMMLNIFTAIFLALLVLSYFASQLLTEPLSLITRKLQRTTLDRNEPLEWHTRDEIGLLVDEYNRMIVKLEESREALSRSEKESAWREMARQVAHEIKNPLTPMKLTLQYLDRALGDREAEELRQMSKKAVNTLLAQVDTLNDIATSFSAFAKMPVPKTEMFELKAVVQKTVDLYENEASGQVHVDLPEQACWVIGDEQLMGRTLTNLILNALQSVPQERKPEVWVRLRCRKQRVIIEVADNGTGIPDAIQEKVFIPNFSTKYAGSGIGLAVAKRGVEHAGGRIWFETEQNVGTRFYIELPLVQPSENGH